MLTIIKAEKKIKNFQNFFVKKIYLILRQYEKIRETFQIYFMVRLRDFRLDRKGTKILKLILELKQMLSDRSKNNCNGSILYLYSCKLIIHYSLSLNNHFIKLVIFHTSCAPAWYDEQDESHPSILSCTGHYPKFHYIPNISELIELQLIMAYA